MGVAELVAFASAIRTAQGKARHRSQRDSQKFLLFSGPLWDHPLGEQ